LTELSNVVAYACRPWSRKDRHDVHHHRRFASLHDARRQPSARPWPQKKTGGKGGKGGNLESAGKTGPADDVAKRRKPAETGGNWFLRPYGGGKVFLEGLRGSVNSVAEIAGIAEIPRAAPRPAITLRITVGSAHSVMRSTVHRLVSATVSSRWNGTGHAQAVQHRLHLLELKIGRALQRNKEAGGNAPSCRIR